MSLRFISGFRNRNFNFESKVSPALHRSVTVHLAKVYSLLTVMLLICAYGAYQRIAFGFFLTFLILLVSLMTIILLQPKDNLTQCVRLFCFALMAYVIGSSLSNGMFESLSLLLLCLLFNN
jgi:hypothetical protein